MDGAWKAQKGFETPEGEFTPFDLKQPIIGNKLEYAFGNATGSDHNISRSMQNENNLNSIGIFDNKEGRSLMRKYIDDAYKQTCKRYTFRTLLVGGTCPQSPLSRASSAVMKNAGAFSAGAYAPKQGKSPMPNRVFWRRKA